jgi:F-type H+-transporting ATPase subunit epsilon
MKLEIITPDKELYKGEAKVVSVPGVDGGMGFLDNHAPLITVLKAGDVKVTLPNGTVETYTVKGGVVEVMNNTVLVLAE